MSSSFCCICYVKIDLTLSSNLILLHLQTLSRENQRERSLQDEHLIYSPANGKMWHIKVCCYVKDDRAMSNLTWRREILALFCLLDTSSLNGEHCYGKIKVHVHFHMALWIFQLQMEKCDRAMCIAMWKLTEQCEISHNMWKFHLIMSNIAIII